MFKELELLSKAVCIGEVLAQFCAGAMLIKV